MPILGAGGETAIQSGGKTTITSNPTRVAYNTNPEWNTVKKPAKSIATPKKSTPAPKPVIKPAPMPVFKPIVNPTSIIAKPITLPINPVSLANPNVSSWQQIQNISAQKPVQNTQPVAKPFSLAGAKAVVPNRVNPNQQQSFLTKPIIGNVSLTHGSLPDYIANALGSGLKKIAASLVPQVVNDKGSDINNPTLAAQKAAQTTGTSNNALDAIKYLLGGLEKAGEGAGNAIKNGAEFMLPSFKGIDTSALGGAGKAIGNAISGLGSDLKSNQAKTPDQLKAQQMGALKNGLNYAKDFLLPNPLAGIHLNNQDTIGQKALDASNNPFGLSQLLPNPFGGLTFDGSVTPDSVLNPVGSTKNNAAATSLANNGSSPWNQMQQLSGKGTANTPDSTIDYSKIQEPSGMPDPYAGPGQGNGPASPSPGGSGADLNSVGLGSGDYSGGGNGMGISSGADGSLSIGGSTFSVNDLMNLGLSSDEVSALHSLADAQAKQQNDVQRQALDTTQAQADATWNNDQQTVNNQLADNAQQLDNSSFQDYLKSRQAIADRGLASSGLSDAANTQLLLAKQQNMAGLQRQADQSLNQARTTHNNATADITGKKALLNDATTAGSIYQQLYQNAMDAKQKNASMALDWAKNQANNATSMGVAQLNNNTKMQIAQLDNQTKLTINENNNATDLQKNAAALDMKQQVLNSQNWNNSQKQVISMANAQYDTAKSLLNALAKDPKNKDLQNQYSIAVAAGNSYLAQASGAVNFSSGSGGGGSSAAVPAVKGTAAFNSNLSAANAKGVPTSANAALSWLVSHESGFNSGAQNPKSTAHGYAQFLNSTAANYDKKMGLHYNNNPVDQLLEMYQYTVDRYGSPQNAVAFWQKNNWY